MSYSLTNDLLTFFQTQLIWIIALVGSLVSALKYLDHKQNNKIEDEVKEQVGPFIADLCKQLSTLKHEFELQRQKTDLTIKSIDNAINHFQLMEENREMKDYRLRDLKSRENYG